MSYADKYLQVHIFFQSVSFEKFCSEIPEFYFKKEVPEDVIKNFQVVEKLLAFSYYEYKFIDEAFAKAIHTFEMAMSIKYKELHLPPPKGKLVFDSLIKSLTAADCFDTDIAVLDHVRQIRNHFSHPERHSFGGAIYWNRIEFISRLINELYENVTLRLERRKITEEFNLGKKGLNLDKFLVMRKGASEPIVLFNLTLLWVNNKPSAHTFLVEYTPLFDLSYETECQINEPEILGIKVINPIFTTKGLIATDVITGEVICFSTIADNPDQIKLFKKWKLAYDSIAWNFMYERSIPRQSSRIFVNELMEFQKM